MMAGSKGRSNAQSLFGVHRIPSDNQIRDLLDAVAPDTNLNLSYYRSDKLSDVEERV
jgi:hypothetical protein